MWDKLKIYLFIWLVIFVVVILMSIISYKEQLGAIIANNVYSAVYGIVVIVITLGGIIMILQSAFR